MTPTTLHINQMYFRVLPCASAKGDIWKDIDAKTWEPETFEFMHNYIEPDKNYIELGSWIGTTAFQAYAYNPKRIYGVEADPANFQTLKHNIALNFAQDKIKPFNVCLTDKANAGKIVSFGTANIERPTPSSHRLDNGSRIKVITTDAWKFLKKNCDLENTNCMNIDIEGSEKYLCETLYKLPGQKTILMSFHSPWWDNKEKIAGDIKRAIKKYEVIDPYSYNLISKPMLYEMLINKSPCVKFPNLTGNFFPIILQKQR